jgi:oligopeptide/dipeptide ABC transporter ATP-binding protein
MTVLLELDRLCCDFAVERSLSAWIRREPKPVLRAVNEVSLSVESGTSIGIVGESGCGKSTLAMAIIGLLKPSSGAIRLSGQEITMTRDRSTRRRVQMVFQDPGASLNPRMTVGDAISEVLRFHRLRPPDGIDSRTRELLDLVELPASVLHLRPSALSGGQKQRVAIARSLALEPEVLIADEAVSALDVSVQASILNLFNDLRRELGLTMLFISHDLGVVRQVTDRVLVLYLGRVVEDQPTDGLFAQPQHPYTRALLAAAPRFLTARDPSAVALTGELPNAVDLPVGCAFASRCPVVQTVCRETRPQLRGPDASNAAACHFAWSSSTKEIS